MTGTYLERLAARSAATGTVLCLGLDPDPATLPDGFSRDLAGVERFATLVVEAAAPHAAAIKPNLAFFEAFGSAGMAALERIRGRLPADLPVVADAKRGDIGSTAARQAVALFDVLGADAVTVNPYLGAEAIAPLLERPDRFAYVLCRTSNPGAGELQDLVVAADADAGFPAEPLHASGRPAGRDLGARRDGRPRRRRRPPRPSSRASGRSRPGLAFLVPGVGAQGGEADAVLEHGPASGPPAGGRPGGGLLVNVSRAIANPPATAGRRGSRRIPWSAVAAAAAEWARKPPCATLARAPDGPRASSRRDAAHTRNDLHRSTTMPNIGAPELIIILVIALLVLGPGKLPEVGTVDRQEHPGIPQGVDRRQGRDEPRPDPAGRSDGPGRHGRRARRRRGRPLSPPSRSRPRPPPASRPPRATDAPRPGLARWPTPTPCATPASRPSR